MPDLILDPSVHIWPARPPTSDEELVILLELAQAMLQRGIHALEQSRRHGMTCPTHEVRLALTDIEGAAVKLIRARQIIDGQR